MTVARVTFETIGAIAAFHHPHFDHNLGIVLSYFLAKGPVSGALHGNSVTRRQRITIAHSPDILVASWATQATSTGNAAGIVRCWRQSAAAWTCAGKQEIIEAVLQNTAPGLREIRQPVDSRHRSRQLVA